MNDFIKKVIEGTGIMPPGECLNNFNQNFTEAVNIDWYDKKTHFEAVFYKDSLEYIAQFSLDGPLIEYQQFLPANFLPEAIKNNLESKGEIMNAVLKNKGNCINYEVIIRDNKLQRHLYLMDDFGKVVDEKVL